MKKLGYGFENKDNFSWILLCILIVGLLILPSIIAIYNNEFANFLPAAIILAIIFIFAIICMKRQQKSNSDYKKQITIAKEKGIKITGKINDIKHVVEKFREPNGEKTYIHKYKLLIEYTNPSTKEKVVFETPILGFNPIHILASRDCSVYVYNDIEYATDFIPVKDGEKSIFFQEDDELYQQAMKVQKNVKRAFAFYSFLGVLCILAVAWLIITVYLHTLNG